MDNLNVYQVFIDGIQKVFENANKKPCMRRCLSLARKGNYVQLWYVHGNGSRTLVNQFGIHYDNTWNKK